MKAHSEAPSNLTPVWQPPQKAEPPKLGANRTNTICSYCGSMAPDELAAAIRVGATISWADAKYGWPHKVYVYGIPNRFAGYPEILTAKYENGEHTLGPVTRSPDKKDGKFYAEHLVDATPEDRATIEEAMGLSFTFHADGRVEWSKK